MGGRRDRLRRHGPAAQHGPGLRRAHVRQRHRRVGVDAPHRDGLGQLPARAGGGDGSADPGRRSPWVHRACPRELPRPLGHSALGRPPHLGDTLSLLVGGPGTHTPSRSRPKKIYFNTTTVMQLHNYPVIILNLIIIPYTAAMRI